MSAATVPCPKNAAGPYPSSGIREGEAQRVGVEDVCVEQVEGVVQHRVADQAICQAVRTGSPRSGAIRLGRCRTSGQLVSTGEAQRGLRQTRKQLQCAGCSAAPARARSPGEGRSAAPIACVEGSLRRGQSIDTGGMRKWARALGVATARGQHGPLRRTARGLPRWAVPVWGFASHWRSEGSWLGRAAWGRRSRRSLSAEARSEVVLADVAPERVRSVVAGSASPSASAPSASTPPAGRIWSR